MTKQNRLSLNFVVADALKALQFYECVLDATRVEIYAFPNRSQENEVNLIVGNVALRLIDANSNYDCFSPKLDQADSFWLQLIVDDVDLILARAERHGATEIQTASEFMGVRHAQFTDPFGYTWTIQQVLKEISFQDRYDAYAELQLKTKVEDDSSEEKNDRKTAKLAQAD